MTRFRRFPLRAALCLAVVGAAGAHEIPVDVRVHALVKPAGNRLQALVRIPLRAVRDVEFPQFGPGYLDVERLEPRLKDLASLWIGAVVEIYENGERLPMPRIAATQIAIQADKSFASFERAAAHVASPLIANGANVVWGPGLVRRPARIPHRVGPLGVCDAPRSSGAGVARGDRPALSAAGRRRPRLRVRRRPRRDAARPALEPGRPAFRRVGLFSTFSKASITCCSCFAWSSPSAGCALWR